MKIKILIPITLLGSISWGQKSEDIIPKDAVTVFSLNNISILQKVSMDELVSYDFMTELQSELFDGSTQGKTLKDAGIDFNQKMNIFYGKNPDFEISGFTFGISDKEKLFTVFDDFDRVESIVPGTEYYNNYFNHLMIQGNLGLLIRVDTDQERLTEITDSIWTARGLELPWSYDNEYYDEGMDGYDEEEMTDEDPTMNEDGDEVEEITEEEINETPIATEETSDLFKNYYELRDSIESEYSRKRLFSITEELFVKKINLKSIDSRLANQLTHPSDGIFYLDNSRNFKNTNSLFYLQAMFPDLYRDLNELYTGNVMLGDIVLNAKSIDLKVEANYGDKLGSIYQELNSAKFDKNVLKYIPKDNTGFFTYQIDLKKGYEKAYEVIMPILNEEKNARISANVLTIELLNDFINTDELFNTYKGSMFGTFNGIKRVKTKRIDFFYNEETFEYGEREIESEEEMPIFTLGFTTARADIPNKILKHMSRITSQFKNMGDYWVYEDAILNSVPLYMINKNGLFIFTNDEDLAKNHSNGYGANAITGKLAKNAAKSGSIYAYMNLGDMVNRLPESLLDDHRFSVLSSMKGKKGEMEIVSTKTSKQKTTYHLTYTFDGTFDNAGKYLLDLVNTAYLVSTTR
jgi:hypothetical protein